MSDNLLDYGDNLDVVRRHVQDESVDLVYLDPPSFNRKTQACAKVTDETSDAHACGSGINDVDYNVLFADRDGTPAPVQIKAFEDTWRLCGTPRVFDEKVSGNSNGPNARGIKKVTSIVSDCGVLS